MYCYETKNENQISGIPDKINVSWEYRNPKDSLAILPLVPRNKQPHIVLTGVYSLDCNYGPDRNKANKRKWVDKKNSEKDVDHSQTSSMAKVIIQRGHKVDCPAKISVKETFLIQDYNCVSTSSNSIGTRKS